MPDQVSSLSLDDPNLARMFRRKLIAWTLAYWTFAFLFLTIRSVIRGAEFLLLQAVLRIPMIAIGLLLCAVMYVFLVWIEHRSRPVKLALIAVAALLATVGFSASAYIVYYQLPGLWVPERGLARALANYTIQFIWIFAAWILIFYYVRFQVLASSRPREFAQELWARQREGQVRIPVEEIEWIESEGDYARVYASQRSYLLRSTMQAMEARLDPGVFVRIHRRVIVTRRLIASIERRDDGAMIATLKSGTSLRVGRNYAARLKAPPGP